MIAQGLGSSPGHAHGAAMLDSDRAAEAAAKGEPVILVRPTTSPKDIRGMLSAGGVVTATGGALSHAAVVSRALDKPCVVGCEAIQIDLARRTFTIGNEMFREGDEISVDGGAGKIYAGAVKLRAGGASRAALDRLLELADRESGSSVWIAPRSAAEAAEPLASRSAGIGVVRLTDLIMSHGSIDTFVRSHLPAWRRSERVRTAGSNSPRSPATPARPCSRLRKICRSISGCRGSAPIAPEG